jgi:hypothetical protein
MPAHGDHDRVAAQLAPVRERDGVGIGERRGTRVVEELDPAAAQRVSQALVVVHVLGDAPGARQRRRDVDAWARAVQSEAFP